MALYEFKCAWCGRREEVMSSVPPNEDGSAKAPVCCGLAMAWNPYPGSDFRLVGSGFYKNDYNGGNILPSRREKGTRESV